MGFIETYQATSKEREALGVPPLPLGEGQCLQVVELLQQSPLDEGDFLLDLLMNRVPPGVDEASKVKAAFLDELVKGTKTCALIERKKAVEILGTMMGGYNVQPLIDALSDSDTAVAGAAAAALKNTLLVYEAFSDVENLMRSNPFAKEVMESWAAAEWFFTRPEMEKKVTVTVFKVPGETNTDDLSPASEAFTRADIPLHAQAMLKSRMPEGLDKIAELKDKGHPVAYVGDVVGTGSSRKSAANSVMWHVGRDIPFVPNKRTGGYVLGGVIAPIFFNTCEDSGVLPIRCPVDVLETGDVIDIYPYEGRIEKAGSVISEFDLAPNTLPDEMRAGGRIPLIIGRGLTARARESLGLGAADFFLTPAKPAESTKGYTLAQKMVGKACGMDGVRPGMSVEPLTSTVGSQDTTGPMTRDEIKELSALGFNADFVLQSFCHTVAYPKASDIKNHHTLPQFITSRGGVSLKPGDGVIHSWLNRFVLPDTVGTGGDSHTRFPLGISFPAGSGLVAFAAVTGSMPLDMPESVLVRFKGEIQPGITLRDVVNAIPYYAMKQGLLTVEKANKKNIFNGRVLEIEGLPKLKVEQAFELSDSSAERSAAACTVLLDQEPLVEFLNSNITLIDAMVEAGYKDADTLLRRKEKMKEWLKDPVLLKPDADAEYAAVIEIDLNEVTEPIVACPNDPDDVATLSEIHANPDRRPIDIDEVFVGSCMCNIGHYRALAEVLEGEGQVPVRLWVVPPTKMDERQLMEEGIYSIMGQAGARMEVPGCSLCMGNQARVKDDTNVFSTSTRNFDNRMGKGAQVYLGSAELAAVVAMLGRMPTIKEYMEIVPDKIAGKEDKIYRYLNFHEYEEYKLLERGDLPE